MGTDKQVVGWHDLTHLATDGKLQGENTSWIFITVYKFKRGKKFLRNPLHCKLVGAPKSWKLLPSSPSVAQIYSQALGLLRLPNTFASPELFLSITKVT